MILIMELTSNVDYNIIFSLYMLYIKYINIIVIVDAFMTIISIEGIHDKLFISIEGIHDKLLYQLNVIELPLYLLCSKSINEHLPRKVKADGGSNPVPFLNLQSGFKSS